MLFQITSAKNVRKYGDGIGVAGFVERASKLVLDGYGVKYVDVPLARVNHTFRLPAGWKAGA